MPTVDIGNNTGDDILVAAEDTMIQMLVPTTNYETANPLNLNKYAADNHAHILIKFPGISSLPGALTVSAATLYLWQSDSQGDPNGVVNVTAKKLNRTWVIDEATWNIWSTGNNWTTAGALHEAEDRSATETFDVSIGDAVAQYYALSHAQLAEDVEDFADGTLVNNGWHLERSDAGNDEKYKELRPEEGSDGQRPYLSVTYEELGGIAMPVVMLQHDQFGGGTLH